jgi:hypothetical protein
VRIPIVFAAVLGTLTGAARLDAQTSFPMITHCTPTAVQLGTTAEVTVEGQMNFAGAYKVIVEGSGVVAEVVPPARPADPKAAVRSVKLKVTASGTMPGVREFRIATPHGVSSLGQLLVVTDPVVAESPGINVPSKAQPVPVPCVVCGRIEAAENVDYYKFRAAAGQVLTLEVHAARLQDKIHDLQKHADPLLAVFDAGGKELAANDDGSFADPLLTFRVPADGEYVVQVRDAKYDGDPRWTYALTVTDKPYAAHIFPLGFSPSHEAVVEAIGSAGLRRKTWTIRPGGHPGIHTIRLTDDQVITNPVACVMSHVRVGVEQEPNDTPAAANPLPIPSGMNGRIGAKRDLDHFRFRGAKGKPVELTVYARRFGTPLRSPLDSALDVMTPDGKVLASNDDANGKDAALTFAPPADGDYVVRVRDLNNKGGEAFVYFLEAGPGVPDFSLKVDPSKAMIGPGSRTAWYVQVARQNGFAGPVKVDVRGLPAGVTVSPLTIPPGMTQGVLVVSADKDAKPDAARVTVLGLAEVKGSHLGTRGALPA